MFKGDPKDLENIVKDLKGLIDRHPDAIQANPDLAKETIHLHDQWSQRRDKVIEKVKPQSGNLQLDRFLNRNDLGRWCDGLAEVARKLQKP